MIVDSHCHLDYSVLYNELDSVISRAISKDVNTLLTICTTLDSYEKIKIITNKYDNVLVHLVFILMKLKTFKILIQI